ncbi:putative P-loop containing nucleoside triphosphate hydrolase protein [Lyophyllum shimeji]|uniref:P-loop containing nucleoside triphosphate hydrolase protein n=1 Tax=Lyophyllum shimeji TaxID=47721 RepID=A0A9P3UML8_LYOSH|nr:putative P-loop containing nucleoside triphosphate hydrolase protein [Lyophyllum shimeji]
MRLAGLVPSISAELVSCLDKLGIRTDTDLVFRPIIEVYRQLPPGIVALRDLENVVTRVTELASAPAMSGADMLKLEMQADTKAPVLSSGIDHLDRLLGGFGGRRVIEIAGDKQSGKTTLALNIVLRHLAEFRHGRAVWLDTTGDFSVEQATEVLKSLHTEAASTALERLQVSLAFDIEAAYNVLEELESFLTPSASPENHLWCIVIDAITPLLGPLLSAVSAQGHSTMTSFMRQLRTVAQRHSCPILVINNATLINPRDTANLSAARKPALGPSFAFLTDATLWLETTGDEAVHDHDREYTVRSAEVLRSKTTPLRSRALFRISRGIIHEQGP